MRARQPDVHGVVEHDGVKIGYEVFGEGEPTFLLLPTWALIHSRFWKMQVPYLARHHRVVTFDGPGNGRSERSTDSRHYTAEFHAGAARAVLDATDTREAIIVSLSRGSNHSLCLAADHPDRVLGQIFVGPSLAVAPFAPERAKIRETFLRELDDPQGWEKYNVHHWLHHYDDFLEFFLGKCFSEPHSTKQIEDGIGWALETTGEALVADAPAAFAADRDQILEWCATIDHPVLVIQGGDDRVSSMARAEALAEATGGELVVLEGAGHIPLARDPVKVNRLIKRFVDEVSASRPVRGHRWTRGLQRRKKALYVSSPIGLGHARRDVAVAQELKRLRPDLQIDWLAQDPVTRVLDAEGETIHPASNWLASESSHFEDESHGHDLHCFQALRNMDEILVANFMIFQEVIEEGLYDVIIADEAWEIDHFWHENPELKRGSHVWFTDFVGYLPMADGGDHEAFLTTDYNAEMIEHIARFPRIRDEALFVGNPDDVIPASFGEGLPKIRDWTDEHFKYSGYITGFTPPDEDQAAEWRDEVGFAPAEKVVVVAVGGSGVGRALIDKVVDAYPLAKRKMDELRMLVVAGPRIDPESLPSHEGLEVVGYVDRLYRHLSVCDLAVVQGGLTTTMELTAACRPFLYFPLRNHFEQNFHVRHRLNQYGAGRCMDYHATNPDDIADAIVTEIGRSVNYAPVETDGAARAAAMIADLI